MADLKDSGTRNMKIILFGGKAESGKTSAANMTKERLEAAGYKAIKLAYGDYVKQTAKMLFGWDGQKDEAGRSLLQWWGTDNVRANHPNFWVDHCIRLCYIIRDMYDFAIIDDARYLNEIFRWTDYEVTTVRVERPGHENGLSPEQRAHISETSLDSYPFDIRLEAKNWTELVGQVDKVLMPELIDLPFAEEKNENN